MKKKPQTFIIVLLALSFSAFATPQTPSLTTLNKNIATIQTDLQQAASKKTHLQKTLAKIETTEGRVTQQLQNTQHTLSQKQKKLTRLKQKTAPLIAEKNQSLRELRTQIRAAYIFSQQPYLKLLLSPNDVTKTHQLLMYFHYITQAQQQSIEQLQQSILAYQENKQAIQGQYQQLVSLKQSQLQNQTILEKTKLQRQELIALLNRNIESKHQKLQAFLRDKQQLENTLARLNAKMTQQHLSPAVLGNTPFAELRGQLSWPLRGRIEDNFGTQIDHSELTWDGTLIEAHANEAVHAVASGKVIFAKWLEGYGLLVIINHGGGYMSLYGRNQSIAVKVGDHIKPGEVIAEVGKSGGFEKDALYFAIRHYTKALNPAHWCK